ncbi:MAG TPA: (4Fe-4S)-binding protein [Pseudonocardiaceae bacterium]
MKIVADTSVCVGAGQCVLTEPALFDQSEEDGTVIVLNAEPTGELAEKAREAVKVCPSQALSIEE